jgi:hypothetical protein
VSGYTRWDGQISLESGDGHWGLDLIGKNLTNKTIRLFNGIQFDYTLKEPPISFAGQVRYRF